MSGYAAAAREALVPDASRTERGMELARAASWDAIVARMWNDLKGE